mmetsp:Transcript_39728/g.95966  ORF Transcript_39728/g.95966 Transcript_39728/m.95966 type:complete len:194 (-) Transcript_39728:42-623(-)
MTHCVRCHKTFTPGDGNDLCIIEHDFDSFEGGRYGEFYEGTLQCCGADHRFHRHYSDDKTVPEYCFNGAHTTDPTEVDYLKSTITICNAKGCGKEHYERTKKSYEDQKERKATQKEQQKAEKKAEKAKQKADIKKLMSEGNRREARKLRADMLGMDIDSDELNSDMDSYGCEEFDCASDSSLVPPWAMDDADY